MIAYVTAPESVIPPAAWVQVGPSAWMPLAPLGCTDWDDGYARMGYEATVAYLATLGARLPKRADLRALLALSVRLSPVCLPDLEMLHARGISPANTAAVDACRVAGMQSAEWCRYHDAKIADQLAAMPNRDPSKPIFGVGKHWIENDDGTISAHHTAKLMGWALADGRWIQSGSNAAGNGDGQHDDRYADYSSTILCVRDEAP